MSPRDSNPEVERTLEVLGTPLMPVSLSAPSGRAVLAPALVNEAGSVTASDGDLLLHYPLNNGWWFVARVDPATAAQGQAP